VAPGIEPGPKDLCPLDHIFLLRMLSPAPAKAARPPAALCLAGPAQTPSIPRAISHDCFPSLRSFRPRPAEGNTFGGSPYAAQFAGGRGNPPHRPRQSLLHKAQFRVPRASVGQMRSSSRVFRSRPMQGSLAQGLVPRAHVRAVNFALVVAQSVYGFDPRRWKLFSLVPTAARPRPTPAAIQPAVQGVQGGVRR
jgi:hypothetical protein